ncbi:CopG family transcriptional regulator [Allorhizobium borbori]|uniref:Metal-responsive CopG/Arc/MetJ family transcriptional regulator n=1 Tax=Allorhizobium borbori TaxID=485907 RepID=A0A7W6P314_9HYPH|nr:CopG family transcriptional regulator [Allorhizobium borbori]MBB4105218.1 metal-responsive CopG/Arc/MetJ family transcriptional regulator [Allorhizobium borbori]
MKNEPVHRNPSRQTTSVLNVSLPSDLAALVRGEIIRGAHPNENELIAAAIRFYLQHHPAPLPAQPVKSGGIFAFGRMFGH